MEYKKSLSCTEFDALRDALAGVWGGTPEPKIYIAAAHLVMVRGQRAEAVSEQLGLSLEEVGEIVSTVWVVYEKAAALASADATYTFCRGGDMCELMADATETGGF